MIVCIAEKPSVGMDLAKVLGATEKHEGYFEGNGYQVTWTLGHLCRLKEPDDYDIKWKRWAMETLPIIPTPFATKLIKDKGIEKQFRVIQKLFSKATEIINCGDAGQEGELIQRWVMQHAKVRCPVKRLWISSLTEEAIREGFRHLSDQSKYDNLYMAGLCRSCGDWLLGMNCTRLYTLKYGGNKQVLSIGRVQTPTLALVVQRDKEIKDFRPESYWVLQTKYRNVLFTSTMGKFKNKSEGEAAYQSILDKPFTVIDVSKKQGSEYPKQLFDLTALQVECNKKYGFSADLTLKTIQNLYEKKLTTYPRVDTRYLSDDIYPKCNEIIQSVTSNFFDSVMRERIREILPEVLPKSKSVFDTSKVTDHHAIIPTGQKPGDLSKNEEKVYALIVRSFVSVFLPDCKYNTTTVKGRVGETDFKVTGKEIFFPGWRILYQNQDVQEDEEKEGKDEEESVLPSFVKNESGPQYPILQSKMTTPPKPYTEATLLQAMETAGKFIEDEELRNVMKENGIGRPSSRAAIIETLFKRNYLQRNKRVITSTITGQELIGIIKYDMLKSCELTGIWEKKLRDIEKGKYKAGLFISELKSQLQTIVDSVKKDNSNRYVTSLSSANESAKRKRTSIGSYPSPKSKASTKKPVFSKGDTKVKANQTCPLCKKGKIIKGKYSYFCSRHNDGCTFKAKL